MIIIIICFDLQQPVILNLYDTCVELRNWITVSLHIYQTEKNLMKYP